MKKIITAIIAVYLLNIFVVKAQQVEYVPKNTCLKPRDMLIDAFYGFPFVYAHLFTNTFFGGSNNSIVSNTNHLGLRGEYMIEERVSLGAELTYAQANISYLSYVSSGNPIMKTAQLSKLRALLKFNFHFKVSSNIDPYITSGLGVKISTNSVTSNYDMISVPIAIRLGAGVRYFFNETAAVHLESGIGGPIMQVGLTYKP